jgi:hypothetical protein
VNLCCNYNYFINDLFKHFVDVELLQNIGHLEFWVLDDCMLTGPPS